MTDASIDALFTRAARSVEGSGSGGEDPARPTMPTSGVAAGTAIQQSLQQGGGFAEENTTSLQPAGFIEALIRVAYVRWVIAGAVCLLSKLIIAMFV